MIKTIYDVSDSNLIFRCGQNPIPDEDARNGIIEILNEHARYYADNNAPVKPITELLYHLCMDIYSYGVQSGKHAERQRKKGIQLNKLL